MIKPPCLDGRDSIQHACRDQIRTYRAAGLPAETSQITCGGKS